MMCYVDTSVIVAMLTHEPKSAVCIEWFKNQKQLPQSTDWLIAEFNSAISLKLRTGQLQAEQATAILQTFETLISGGIKLLPINREIYSQAGALIRSHPNLRAGDALYLSVALGAGIKEFVTLDNNQSKTAQEMGFSCEVM
ncbi:type II toxin-antitoxin system VapC family toxin [Methylophilus aquaticus]|uniref:Type II toxin-antitoxin system VapC family toxin n=1 Tax=Methylophilus aquaticus TaxID=1971610 RepID=A0ABT9JNW7_9PROT|nr:type II toxin-antitoxin system VapC family toxin [Methylophilus aquaticus]MDP8566278.1 type II toxin-antitoxin system VapC family toxin [Methylophilus aquaticus]